MYPAPANRSRPGIEIQRVTQGQARPAARLWARGHAQAVACSSTFLNRERLGRRPRAPARHSRATTADSGQSCPPPCRHVPQEILLRSMAQVAPARGPPTEPAAETQFAVGRSPGPACCSLCFHPTATGLGPRREARRRPQQPLDPTAARRRGGAGRRPSFKQVQARSHTDHLALRHKSGLDQWDPAEMKHRAPHAQAPAAAEPGPPGDDSSQARTGRVNPLRARPRSPALGGSLGETEGFEHVGE